MAAEAPPPAAAAEPPAPPPAPSAASASAPPSSSPAAAAPLGRSPYPFAYAPDIIRSHQKDAYFQGVLTNQLADLHRNLLGARSAHGWAPELRTFADLLYLSLTTLIGNRTLGEEYCGLVQVESETGGSRLPNIRRRAGYIAGSILLPYGLSKVLPALRSRVRKMLERNLERLRSGGGKEDSKNKSTTTKQQQRGGESTMSYRLQSYILANLSSITSPAPVHAVSLALFYFSGSYYEMAKRFVGLRYIFTHKVGESSDRAGYEVLGVLLVIQMLVQGYLHVQSNLLPQSSSSSSSRERSGSGEVVGAGDVHVSLEEHAYSSNNSLLMAGGIAGAGTGSAADQQTMRIGLATSTPIVAEGDGAARHDLSDPETMRWIKGAQQRKCTLCLEELKDPSATSCGHVFCWVCIGDWVREKPECPLCRREAMVQHILPLRAC